MASAPPLGECALGNGAVPTPPGLMPGADAVQGRD